MPPFKSSKWKMIFHDKIAMLGCQLFSVSTWCQVDLKQKLVVVITPFFKHVLVFKVCFGMTRKTMCAIMSGRTKIRSSL